MFGRGTRLTSDVTKTTSPLAVDHRRHDGAGQTVRGDQVHVELGGEVGLAGGEHALGQHVAGVGHQHLDRAERLGGVDGETADGVAVADVQAQRDRLSAVVPDGGGEGLAALLAPGGEDHRMACPGEHGGGRRADAGRRTGDQGGTDRGVGGSLGHGLVVVTCSGR